MREEIVEVLHHRGVFLQEGFDVLGRHLVGAKDLALIQQEGMRSRATAECFVCEFCRHLVRRHVSWKQAVPWIRVVIGSQDPLPLGRSERVRRHS